MKPGQVPNPFPSRPEANCAAPLSALASVVSLARFMPLFIHRHRSSASTPWNEGWIQFPNGETRLLREWNNLAAWQTSAPRCGLHLAESSLVLSASWPLSPLKPRGEAGVFTAELWKGDVAELFLVHPAARRYLEVNLSPTGAWWTCLFSSPRVAVEARGWPAPGIKAGRTQDKVNGHHAEMAIPLDELTQALAFQELAALSGNLTVICKTPHGNIFASAAPLPGTRPDFHQPDHWLPLRNAAD